mgnify:CR=1 FL=1
MKSWEEIKAERASVMNSQQQRIFEDKLEALTGKEMTVIVDGFDENEMLYFGRSYMDAPEIDTQIYFTCGFELDDGDIVEVEVINVIDGELTGEVV